MLSTLDYSIIFAYLSFSLVVGVWVARKSSDNLESYFVAGRSLPWWWLGTSMVATTFAADTPLAVTGIIAKDGIAGNWFWWCWAFSFMAITVFFARKWVGSRVLTDVELIELRYEGKPAAALRGVKALYLSIIVNCIILGWVFRAMSKISNPFIDWKEIIGAAGFAGLQASWPSVFIFDDLNNTLTVLGILVLVVTYSSLGGIRGVILTDLVQFFLAVFGAVIFAYYAVDHVGGFSSLYAKLGATYPQKADQLITFWPSFEDDGLFPLTAFLVLVGMQWWTKYFSDGSGYFSQRINTARDEDEAQKGSLWFTFAFFFIRPWPWVMVGLVALVVFPLGQDAALGGDREMAYPVLMKQILPSGLLGLTLASLLAAFMSTVDTHLNWGTSYLVNDIYKRYIRPEAKDRELVLVSRLAVVGLAIIAIVIAGQINSIEGAWKFFVAIASGMGLPQMLRWLWWRANAYTEIAGMSAGLFMSVLLYSLFPKARSEHLLFFIAGTSVIVAIVATLLTPPVSDTKLRQFTDRVRPIGFWRDLSNDPDLKRFRLGALAWLLGSVSVFSGMFAIGYALLLEFALAIGLLVLFGASLYGLLHFLAKPELK